MGISSRYIITLLIFLAAPLFGLAQEKIGTEEITQENPRMINGMEVYDASYVEVQPEYPGGIRAFYEFLVKTIIYPGFAKEQGVHGKVFIQFIITQTGKIDTNSVVVLKGHSDILNRESIRAIKLSPDWVPAKVSGKNVNCLFVIPIVFKLPEEESKTPKN